MNAKNLYKKAIFSSALLGIFGVTFIAKAHDPAMTANTVSVATSPPSELPTLEQRHSNEKIRTAFKAMMAGRTMPEWLRRGSLVVSPTRQVGFGGKSWLLMSACRPHDCSTWRVAVLYQPQDVVMHGVISQTRDNGINETLTWLSVGDGEESIDGRTILYAAISGSAQNHPEKFNYNAE